jgi:hypothetical protein
VRGTLGSWNRLFAKLGLRREKRRKRGQRNYLSRTLRLEPLEQRQMLSITVNVGFDENDHFITDGDVSLRDAIENAPAGDTINFAPSLNGAKIDLDGALGEIAFAKSLTIDASMLPNGITIDASGNDPTPTINARLVHDAACPDLRWPR